MKLTGFDTARHTAPTAAMSGNAGAIRTEPRRVFRRPFRVSHAASAVCCVCRWYGASGSVVVDRRHLIEERPGTRNLTKLSEGLSRPRTQKRVEKVWERIGRLKATNQRVAQHYDIELDTDPSAERATAVRFTRRPVEGSMMTHPGVYCLRSNQTDWDEETLWRTYVTLTDLEAVFRSLKSELGLRPIFHHKPIRAEGHLFISVIACQLVQLIRRRLRQAGGHASWNTIRRILEGQQRITATFRRADGRTLHVRKATCAEPPQHAIYDALGIDPAPGETHKTIV